MLKIPSTHFILCLTTTWCVQWGFRSGSNAIRFTIKIESHNMTTILTEDSETWNNIKPIHVSENGTKQHILVLITSWSIYLSWHTLKDPMIFTKSTQVQFRSDHIQQYLTLLQILREPHTPIDQHQIIIKFLSKLSIIIYLLLLNLENFLVVSNENHFFNFYYQDDCSPSDEINWHFGYPSFF